MREPQLLCQTLFTTTKSAVAVVDGVHTKQTTSWQCGRSSIKRQQLTKVMAWWTWTGKDREKDLEG